MTSTHDDRFVRSFGRRRGKVLRAQRSTALANALQKFEIPSSVLNETILDPSALFGDAYDDIWLEIGFGNGEYLLHQALNNPHIGMIGCEPYVNGIAALGVAIQKHNITNIRIWPDDARPLMAKMKMQSIGRLFLINSDPWPKTRHHKRRFVQKETLDDIHRILKPGAEFRMATDHAGLAAWQLEKTYHHSGFDWTATCAADWRIRPPDTPETRYQKRGVTQGNATTFLNFIRNQ